MKLWSSAIYTDLFAGNSVWLVIAAIVLPGLVAFFWVAFFRRTRRRHKHRRPHSHRQGMMNPTLEQTGGLPPIRTPETSPDQPKS